MIKVSLPLRVLALVVGVITLGAVMWNNPHIDINGWSIFFWVFSLSLPFSASRASRKSEKVRDYLETHTALFFVVGGIVMLLTLFGPAALMFLGFPALQRFVWATTGIAAIGPGITAVPIAAMFVRLFR
jgi:hypothetical protein